MEGRQDPVSGHHCVQEWLLTPTPQYLPGSRVEATLGPAEGIQEVAGGLGGLHWQRAVIG